MLHYSGDIREEFDKWEKIVGNDWGRENMMKYVTETSDCEDNETLDSCSKSKVCIMSYLCTGNY